MGESRDAQGLPAAPRLADMFEINPDLPRELMGLAWMIGRWEGNGHGQTPEEGEFEYGQTVEFTHNGGDFLYYLSQLYTVDADGTPVEPLMQETGYWRPQANGEVELVLANPSGWAEVWAGRIEGAKIELVTDAVMRTQTAAVEYTGGQRLYGNVEGDLLWTMDRATTGTQLQPWLWARLKRA